MTSNEEQQKRPVLRFGIPTLDRLLGTPSLGAKGETGARESQQPMGTGIGLHSFAKNQSGGTDGEGHQEVAIKQDAISACLIGVDGVGKSILAMHMASQYRADINRLSQTSFLPTVIYASTDLTHGRADVSWHNFALQYPDQRIDDPFDIRGTLDRFSKEVSDENKIVLQNHKPLEDDFPEACRNSVFFIDLATNTTGDDWGYINRLVGSLQDPQEQDAKHLLIVDAVEGLEVLVGEIDAYGQRRDRRSRVAQLIRTAADKCHLVFLVEANEEGKKTPEEFIADAVIRLGSNDIDGYLERYVQVEKVRAQAHVPGAHAIVMRSGRGSTTGRMVNPDDPPVLLPNCRAGAAPFVWYPQLSSDEIFQSYIYVFHSLNLINRRVMTEHGDQVRTRTAPLAGFGIENLDNMLETDHNIVAGDSSGIRASDPVALIGEDGTYKSKLSKAFLARAHAKEGSGDVSDSGGISILVTTKTLESEGVRERMQEHLGKKIASGHRVLCRRLEVHVQSAESLYHILLQMVRRAQVTLFLNLDEQGQPRGGDWKDGEDERRQHSSRIRLVIDNWTSIRDMYPKVRENPLFLPCLMFFLRREGIPTLIVANEDRGFSDGFNLKTTRRLRDLTSTQIFTWRVPYFGESRVAITITPPLQSNGQGSVIRELRVLKNEVETVNGEKRYVRPKHLKEDDSWKITVNRVFELYEGLERGVPKYVPLRVFLYAGSRSANRYFEDVRYLFDRITNSGDADEAVLREENPENYDRLREFCELQGVARYPYTLVLQVDEYWARSQALQLHSQENYLNAMTAEIVYDENQKPAQYYDFITDDPFRLFQPSLAEMKPAADPGRSLKLARHDYFSTVGYDLSESLRSGKRRVQKIPYSWDFGFLMLNRCAWRLAEDSGTIPLGWKSLPCLDENEDRVSRPATGWREFAEACVQVAKLRNSAGQSDHRYVPFAVAPEIQETISCLFLEIWVSEIDRRHGQQNGSFFPCRRDDESRGDLADAFREFKDEACRALLLMMALLPPEVITDNNVAMPQNDDNNIPIAVRTWFSAAETTQEPRRVEDVYLPARLPGTRSVRGDWFLATARGSRSYQMGERAIDLLCSRRGNILRLQNGIGLPVRGAGEAGDEFWTPLWHYTEHNQRSKKILYEELTRIGAGKNQENEAFKWIWRSRLVQYDRHARLLRRWICSSLRQRNEFLGDRSPFEAYDEEAPNAKVIQRIENFLQSIQRATVFESSDIGDRM